MYGYDPALLRQQVEKLVSGKKPSDARDAVAQEYNEGSDTPEGSDRFWASLRAADEILGTGDACERWYRNTPEHRNPTDFPFA